MTPKCHCKVSVILIRMLVTLALLLVPTLVSADTIIDTSPSWDGDPQDAVQPWGATNTTTYGQTFTVGIDTLLKSFSFNVWNTGNSGVSSAGPIPYTARVYQWDSTAQTAIGPALYVSPISTLPFTGGYQVVTASPDTNLVSGLQYVALFTTSGAWSGTAPEASAFWAAIFNSNDTMMADVYPGGGFVDINNGNDPSLLTGSKWNQVSGDLWFQADLAPVPEPGTLSLLGIGFAGIWVMNHRARRRTQ